MKINEYYNYYFEIYSPYHSAEVMGGMWGGIKGALPNINELIENYYDKYLIYIKIYKN